MTLEAPLADVVQAHSGYAGDMVALAIKRNDANTDDADIIDMSADARHWRH